MRHMIARTNIFQVYSEAHRRQNVLGDFKLPAVPATLPLLQAIQTHFDRVKKRYDWNPGQDPVPGCIRPRVLDYRRYTNL